MSIDPYGVLASLAVLGVLLVFIAKHYPDHLVDFLRWLKAPSESQIKKKSDEMLEHMNRNIAERKRGSR